MFTTEKDIIFLEDLLEDLKTLDYAHVDVFEKVLNNIKVDINNYHSFIKIVKETKNKK